jgi:hypothetical protein
LAATQPYEWAGATLPTNARSKLGCYRVSPIFIFSITSENLSGGRISFITPMPIHRLATCHTIAIGTQIHQVAVPKNGHAIAAIQISKVKPESHYRISRSIGRGLSAYTRSLRTRTRSRSTFFNLSFISGRLLIAYGIKGVSTSLPGPFENYVDGWGTGADT